MLMKSRAQKPAKLDDGLKQSTIPDTVQGEEPNEWITRATNPNLF